MSEKNVKLIKANNSNIYITFMISFFPLGMLAFILPIYCSQLKISPLLIGIIFSIYSITTFFTKIVFGKHINKMNLKKMYSISLLILAISMLLFAYSQNFYLLFTARILQGIAFGFLILSFTIIIAKLSSNENSGESFGKMMGMQAKGAGIGAFIGFFIIGWYSNKIILSWQTMFIVFAILIFISFVMSLKIKIYGLDQLENTKLDKKFIKKIFSPLLVTFLFNFGYSMILLVIILFLNKSLHLSIMNIADAYIISLIVRIILPKKIGKYSDKYGKKLFVIIGFLFVITSSVSMAYTLPLSEIFKASPLRIMIYLWVIEAIGVSCIVPSVQSLMKNIAGDKNVRKTFAASSAVKSLGFIFGPLLAGVLFEISYFTAFVAVGIIFLIGFIVSFTLKNTIEN